MSHGSEPIPPQQHDFHAQVFPRNLDALLPQLTRAFAVTAAAHDMASSFPFENFEILHRQGLLALTGPADLGGSAADLRTSLRVVQAVAKGEPATALILTMQYLHLRLLGAGAVWPDSLRRRVMSDAVEAGALINSLRVEPDLGTPARGGLPSTTARRTPDGWRVTGRKLYSTGAPALSWYVVWARSDDEPPLVGGWLIHRDTPGVRIEESWDHLGLRASCSHDVILEDALVPLDYALDPQPLGTPALYPSDFFAWASVLIAAIYDGVAQAARDWLVGWLIERKPGNLGASLSTLPRFQQAVGVIDSLLFSNRALLEQAARGALDPVEADLVKHLVTENAILAVGKALELTGNPGLSRHNPLERHYRDVLCGRIHTPQADVVLANAGKAAFATYGHV